MRRQESPADGAYTDQYNNYEWQEFTELAMEEVDADKEWAAYKLVATMADSSRRIVFFTDPTAESGQLQMLGFNADFSVFYFDTGIRSWGGTVDPTDARMRRTRLIHPTTAMLPMQATLRTQAIHRMLAMRLIQVSAQIPSV